MHASGITMSVVLDGSNGSHTAREFVSPHDRLTYVEGREGSNFVIRMRNGTRERVLAIPSVDGISVLDNKPAGVESGGFILEPGREMDLPGWIVDGETTARFVFSGLKSDGTDESYAVLSGNGAAHKGVIGIKVLRERAPIKASTGILRSASPSFAAAATLSASGSASSAPMAMNAVAQSSASSQVHENTAAEPVEQTLGTGFGAAARFVTRHGRFDRGEVLDTLEIGYDDRRGLKRRGIEVDRPVLKRPSAFPADVGCTPPAGWQR